MAHIYFAAPLFSQAEVMYNEMVVDKIRKEFGDKVTVYLPQENAEINDKNAYASSIDIIRGDIAEIDKSDIMIALLDGPTMDEGVASEIGYAFKMGIPIYGLLTDSRQKGATNPKKLEAIQSIGESQFVYRNLFTVGMVKASGGDLVSTVEDLLDVVSFNGSMN